MADFSATESALIGFRFVRERPRAALAWAGVQLVIQALGGVVMVLLGGQALMDLQALQRSQPADPAAVLGLMGQLAPLYLLFLVFALAFYPVLYGAMNRGVLRPQDSRFAYLRLSADELRLFLLLLLIVAVVIGGAIVSGVVGGIVSVAARSAAPWAAVIVWILICAGWVYVWVRLSLAWALTFDSGRVDLFGSWDLTRGKFWKLLATYLLVAVLALIVAVLVMIVGVVISAIAGGGLTAASGMFKGDTSSFAAYFTPARLVMLVVWSAASGLLWPLTLMPPAEIYRQLTRGA